MKATVVVRPKEGILDPQGEAVLGALRHLDFTVDEVRIGRVIDIELSAKDAESARAEIARMCEQLLANSLIESFEIEVAE
jgi:phosphoribosylformylglycinamidine synthase subunit PurS